ncbi:hypothetical protein ACFSTI_02770 [Rhizorhabdus histidinilytica]
MSLFVVLGPVPGPLVGGQAGQGLESGDILPVEIGKQRPVFRF